MVVCTPSTHAPWRWDDGPAASPTLERDRLRLPQGESNGPDWLAPQNDGAVALRRGGIDWGVAGATAARLAHLAVALAIVAVAVSAVWLALTSDHLERP